MKIYKQASALTLADRVELNSSNPKREINSELYGAICSALPTPQTESRWVTSEAKAITDSGVSAHYSKGRTITVKRVGPYTSWRTELSNGTVNYTYKKIKD